MALKESDLYSSLWQSCDELRGGMDVCQHKDYVLVLLFVKYLKLQEQERESPASISTGKANTSGASATCPGCRKATDRRPSS